MFIMPCSIVLYVCTSLYMHITLIISDSPVQREPWDLPPVGLVPWHCYNHVLCPIHSNIPNWEAHSLRAVEERSSGVLH